MGREREPAVYILASGRHGTLYIGVTSNLLGRIQQHREELTGGFTAEHGVKRLVYYEPAYTMETAITREKQLKNWRRDWKIALIEKDNRSGKIGRCGSGCRHRRRESLPRHPDDS